MNTDCKIRIFGRKLAVASLLFAALGSKGYAQSTYTPYTFTTLAGLPKVSGHQDGTNSTARFFYPSGVAVSPSGTVYVADTHTYRIRKISESGVVTTLVGGTYGSADGTNSAAQFKEPTGLALDSAGNLYVADKANFTIRKVTPDGVVTTLAGSAGNSGSADGTNSTARFRYPFDVAVDSADNIYVADTDNHTIRQITPDGIVTTLAGMAGASGSADGTGSDARFNGPTGVAVDSLDNIYVADYYNDTIRKVTDSGTVTTIAGLAESAGSADGTNATARFHFPSGVAVDSAGNVFVADSNNETIRRVTPGGVVTTLAGLAEVSGSADGTGSVARFDAPTGVAVDDAGNVYVADNYNDTIRKGWPLLTLSGGGITNQWFHFTLTGPSGGSAVISASTNLEIWVPLATNPLVGGSFDFTDASVSNYNQRFYRASLP